MDVEEWMRDSLTKGIRWMDGWIGKRGWMEGLQGSMRLCHVILKLSLFKTPSQCDGVKMIFFSTKRLT
jgi:hypothetical protein